MSDWEDEQPTGKSFYKKPDFSDNAENGNGNGRSNGYDNDEWGGGSKNADGDGDRNNRGDGGGRGRGRGRGRGGGMGRGRGNDRPYNDRNNNDNNDDYGERRRRGRGDDEGGDGDDGEPKAPREFYIPPEPTNNEEEMFSTGISSGINFSEYSNIPIKVSGENVPPRINSFDETGLRSLILDNVKRSGYKVPTPIQKTAIPAIMAGRDIMGCAQTGSGKTAAYLLPIIHKILEDNKDASQPQALVVAPTRELAIQIYNEARKYSFKSYVNVGILYGGTSSKHQSENIQKGCHILIATVGRLLDFAEKRLIDFSACRFLVLDEADRMLDMGFKPSIEKIMDHVTMPPSEDRQTLMFSATFPEVIQNMAFEFMHDYIFITIGILGGACSDVEQKFVQVNRNEKRVKLREMLNEEAAGTIVFVETKRNADFLASFLSESAFPTTSIHGDRLQRQREEALRDFKAGKMKILIATAVAARGLDIKNVRHVINYDLPDSIDEYVHRIGRTGRVGNRGRATSFFDSTANSGLAPALVSILKGANQEVPDFLKEFADGGHYGNNYDDGFGGFDVRQDNAKDGPTPLEPEDTWD